MLGGFSVHHGNDTVICAPVVQYSCCKCGRDFSGHGQNSTAVSSGYTFDLVGSFLLKIAVTACLILV